MMFWSPATADGGLTDLLSTLPDGWRWIEHGRFHVVVGVTGAFVLAEASARDVERIGNRVARAAERLRGRLAQAVVWVPFVEALVVTDDRVRARSTAAVVPRRLVHDLLLSGPRLLDDAVVDRIAELVATTD